MYESIKKSSNTPSCFRPRVGALNKKYSANSSVIRRYQPLPVPNNIDSNTTAQLFTWNDLKSSASKALKVASVLTPAALADVMEAINPLSSLTKEQRIEKILGATKSVAIDQLSSILVKVGVPADIISAVIGQR